MRYPDSGGLSDEGRAKRETVRSQAAEWFAQDMPVAQIARRLRVSSTEGPAGLASKGPGGSACRLDDARLARPSQALKEGPAGHGFDEDQRWTLSRVSAALLDAAHQRLGCPIVVIWDNLNTHRSAAMRELIANREWLRVIRLPAYAPELNPVEHVWSHLERGLGNLLVWGLPVAVVKNSLRRVQYRPRLLDAFFAHTRLDLEPP
ncbi:MAG TPA: transposase [Pseudonocardiaceae bacterium]|nr:transposase [Pseudonocardiaceae bacterium]